MKKSIRDVGREAESARQAAVNPPSREHDASVVNGGRSHMSAEQQLMQREMSEPKRVGAVLHDVMGTSSADPSTEALALEIIHDSGVDLRLGLKEWRAVTDLVEAGIRKGLQISRPTPR
ncbi:hypothetical protein SEA_YUUY_64 [Microbacterium phage YuuY]|nr:hypothetical protein SEA_YUUY_64 [Microbacterium phage YuuY]